MSDERVDAAAKAMFEADLARDRVFPGSYENLRPYFEADAAKILAAADRVVPLPKPSDAMSEERLVGYEIACGKPTTFNESVVRSLVAEVRRLRSLPVDAPAAVYGCSLPCLAIWKADCERASVSTENHE